MKKILLLAILLFMAVVGLSAADKPKAGIQFEETEHDFGTIHASNGRVTATYPFTNTGDAPLVIISVTNGGCGCTTPDYPKAPIMPGETGVITIKFDPTGRRGEFNREVKVKTNSSSRRNSLKFSGTIIP